MESHVPQFHIRIYHIHHQFSIQHSAFSSLSLSVLIPKPKPLQREMLGYEWGTHNSPDPPPQLILTDDINHHHDPSSSSSHHHRPIFDDPFSLYNLHIHHQTPPPIPLYDTDPRLFPGAYHHHSMLTMEATTGVGPGPVMIPKAEPEYTNRIGLNLGGRTYFAANDDVVSRLYRRFRGAEPVKSPKCQAEGCYADLSNAKHYHRRHKVCEFHSKAATVVAAGLTQRFCQQCSRFHLLSEFDNGKRSCRKRLADHNRRRRKSHQSTNGHQRLYSDTLENAPNSSSQIIQKSPSDSGANSSSSVTIAVSSPLASFDSSFRQRSYE